MQFVVVIPSGHIPGVPDVLGPLEYDDACRVLNTVKDNGETAIVRPLMIAWVDDSEGE